MALSLHHVFVLTSPDAPGADALVELGMVEGSRNTHPGQGTANRRFFFDDLYLEFVFFTDVEEARHGPGRVIRSLDRFESPDGSPFGLIFRAETGADLAMFPSFPYQPKYFEDGTYFSIGDNADRLDEPSCIVLPVILPPAPGSEPRSTAPFANVTQVRVSLPARTPSDVLAGIEDVDRLTLVTGEPHLMEITFGAGEHEKDLRPDLPLIIRW